MTSENKRAQLLLPFAEREYVDMQRAGRILGVSWQVVYRMAESGLLQLIDYRARGWKKIRYQSIVDHCDRLRADYAIPDRRPPLSSPILRHKDEDLLPFPLRETITFQDVQRSLGFSSISPVLRLLEEGRFECYRLHPGAPWRISTPSFHAYRERCLAGIGPNNGRSSSRGPYKLTD